MKVDTFYGQIFSSLSAGNWSEEYFSALTNSGPNGRHEMHPKVPNVYFLFCFGRALAGKKEFPPQ
jgi:hypothetical protein